MDHAVVELVTDRPELADLLGRARQRGYLLLSDLHDHRRPAEDGHDWLRTVIDALHDAGVAVVDDLSEDTDGSAAEVMTSSADPVRHYLNGIGRTALLTAEEEVDLAKRDVAGRSARNLLARGGVTPRQRALLRQIDKEGREAQDHMVRANLRLVVSIARRYRGRGLDLLDLVQEGNLGLIRAVEKFDHTRGYKFSTYATWWIRQALTRGLADKSRTLRLPVHVHETLGKMRWVELDLLQQLGRDPTEDEVAQTMGMALERVREIRSAARELLSLDLPIGEDGDATVGSLVRDDADELPEELAALAVTKDLLKVALNTLTDRERGVVMLRFGLVDGECRTLEEVGAQYGVTRERIRQIEAKTLVKLRHPSRSDRLRGLLGTGTGGSTREVV